MSALQSGSDMGLRSVIFEQSGGPMPGMWSLHRWYETMLTGRGAGCAAIRVQC